MGEAKFYVLEWNIDNFSHWDNEIHETVITSSRLNTNPQYTIELYPRGLSGKEERLELGLCSSDPSIFSGEVSLIGSDGSLLCTLEVKPKHKLKVFFLDPGPTFDEVVDKIRENEAHYKDRLTVKYRFKSKFNNIADFMHTTIDVSDISLKVTSEVLLNSNSNTKAVAWLYYPINENETRNMILEVKRNEVDDSEVLLLLRPFTFEKNISIFTRMTLHNYEQEVEAEENEHIFRDGDAWIFPKALRIEEIKENLYFLILNIEIIPSTKYRHSVRAYSLEGGGITMIPLNRFTHPDTYEKSCSEISVTPPSDSAKTLANELMGLYQDQDFSDFQLKCGAVSFQVHRAILSARSPVFKTMLSTDMKEAVSSEVDIKDLDAPTLCRFLAFLYTGNVEDLQSDSALKLYYAADKYQVPTLKKECADFLSDEVSVSNVCGVLSLADKHRDEELLSVVHDFFLENFNEILGSEEWKSFMASEPLLAVKTVTQFRDQITVSRP